MTNIVTVGRGCASSFRTEGGREFVITVSDLELAPLSPPLVYIGTLEFSYQARNLWLHAPDEDWVDIVSPGFYLGNVAVEVVGETLVLWGFSWIDPGGDIKVWRIEL